MVVDGKYVVKHLLGGEWMMNLNPTITTNSQYFAITVEPRERRDYERSEVSSMEARRLPGRNILSASQFHQARSTCKLSGVHVCTTFSP